MSVLKFQCDCSTEPELLINVHKSVVPIAKIECFNCGAWTVTLNVSMSAEFWSK
jgi:hypothetical protein